MLRPALTYASMWDTGWHRTLVLARRYRLARDMVNPQAKGRNHPLSCKRPPPNWWHVSLNKANQLWRDTFCHSLIQFGWQHRFLPQLFWCNIGVSCKSIQSYAFSPLPGTLYYHQGAISWHQHYSTLSRWLKKGQENCELCFRFFSGFFRVTVIYTNVIKNRYWCFVSSAPQSNCSKS